MNPLKNDSRYTVFREWCGFKEPRFVARFCDEWIGQGERLTDAIMLCLAHSDERMRKINAD